MTQSAFDEGERRRFVADPDVLAAMDIRLDDLADPDVRSDVIREEHPEFEDAYNEDLDEVDLGYGPINPRLHVAMHEIVATQLWDGDPPEVWETALRLRDAGYERHEVLHMLAAPIAEQIHATLHAGEEYDLDRHLAALAALPRSWERRRTQRTLKKQDPHGRHTARRRPRH